MGSRLKTTLHTFLAREPCVNKKTNLFSHVCRLKLSNRTQIARLTTQITIQWYHDIVHFGISPTWYTSCLDAKHFTTPRDTLVYLSCVLLRRLLKYNDSRNYSVNFVFFLSNFGIRPVWYKSKDLESIKDVYRGITVLFM